MIFLQGKREPNEAARQLILCSKDKRNILRFEYRRFKYYRFATVRSNREIRGENGDDRKLVENVCSEARSLQDDTMYMKV